MTIKETLNRYHVVDGIIRSDGEYKDLPLWVPYVFETMEASGMLPEEGEHVVKAIINVRDRAEFPDLEGIASVEIHVRYGEFYRLGKIKRRNVATSGTRSASV